MIPIDIYEIEYIMELGYLHLYYERFLTYLIIALFILVGIYLIYDVLG